MFPSSPGLHHFAGHTSFPFLSPSVKFPSPLLQGSHTLFPNPPYINSLPAGRKFLQATVLLTWQQFPDSSFEMFATLSETENKSHNLLIFNEYLYLFSQITSQASVISFTSQIVFSPYMYSCYQKCLDYTPRSCYDWYGLSLRPVANQFGT